MSSEKYVGFIPGTGFSEAFEDDGAVFRIPFIGWAVFESLDACNRNEYGAADRYSCLTVPISRDGHSEELEFAICDNTLIVRDTESDEDVLAALKEHAVEMEKERARRRALHNKDAKPK